MAIFFDSSERCTDTAPGMYMVHVRKRMGNGVRKVVVFRYLVMANSAEHAEFTVSDHVSYEGSSVTAIMATHRLDPGEPCNIGCYHDDPTDADLEARKQYQKDFNAMLKARSTKEAR